MAITKYASFEVNSILEVKGSADRENTPTFSKVAAFEDFRTEDGYLYARIRAISSRVNKNHDGWPSIELAGSQDIFDHHTASSDSGFTVNASSDAEYGFSTFLGKPIFVDHHNSDPSRARGVIVDAKLHVEDHKTAAIKDSYYRDAPSNHCPPAWVELLLEVDAKSFPKLAKAIIDGSRNAKRGIDGFSMGCDVERSVCNICKNSATTPEEFCNHVKMKGAIFDYYDDMGRKTSKKSYEDCLTPETPILMKDGSSKPISKVEVGDYVIDHLGQARKVEKTYIRPESGQIYGIHRMGRGLDAPLEVTGNHPVLIVRGSGVKRGKLEKDLKSGFIEPEFIEAKDIQEGDWVVEVAPDHRPKLTHVKTLRVMNNYIASDIPKSIELNEDFGRWCGWYLAEGCIQYNRLSSGERSESTVHFSLHANEEDYRNEILRLGKKLFGLSGKVTIKNNSAEIKFYNKPLAVFMKQLGTSSLTKALPHDWLAGPIQFINGVSAAHRAGDGYQDTKGYRENEIVHITSSKVLADQLYQMNIWLGHTPSRRLDKPSIKNKRTIAATHVSYQEKPKRNPRGRISFGPWNLSKISQIDKINYQGNVHNLHVADTRTYVANGQAVHNCYGIKFFEISAVFDPADETALIREVRSNVKESSMDEKLGTTHKADHDDRPQNEKARAPESIDTLRKEKICEVCGSDMEGPQCDVCGWESEPEGFDNPDLSKAKKERKKREEEREHEDKHHDHDHHDDSKEDAISKLETDVTKNLPTVAHITDTDQDSFDLRTAQINKIERPVLPVQVPASNEPKEIIVKDQDKPNTSTIRTASDFVAAANYNKRNNMEQQHTADATSTAPAVAKPDYSTDVIGIGGVGDSSNQGASEADAQVSVSDIGGVSGVGTGDEKTVDVAQGDEHSKNIEAIHTDTFGPGEGDSLGQHDPVSSDPFPASAEGVHSSSWVVSDVQGTQPADPVGNAQERINVTDDSGPHGITTQDSGPTATFPDGNSAVTRQADPVTDVSFYDDQNSSENHPTGVEAVDHAFGKDSSAHLMSAFKLADTEIELGLLDPSQKYERVAELEQAAPSVVEASLNYADRVKTAGLKKAVKTAKRLPSLAKGASSDAPRTNPEEPEDFALFM